MQTLSRIIAGALFVSALHQSRAQVPGALELVDSLKQRRTVEQSARTGFKEGDTAPELYPGEASDVGPQSVLEMKSRKTYFEALADAQYFYTDNLFLTKAGKQETGVLVSTAQLALAPTPYPLGTGTFAPRVGYRHQWFDFGLDGSRLDGLGLRLNAFDFNAQTIFTDGRWTHGNWMAEAGFDCTRLMSTARYDEFYTEYVPRWGVQRFFPLNDKMAVSLGYEGDYRFTKGDVALDKDFNDRTDQALFAAWTQTLCPQALVQPYYRFKYTHFTAGGDRDDHLHSLGLALHCFFTPQISLRAFVGYDLKESRGRDSAEDYRRLESGGGLNLTIRF